MDEQLARTIGERVRTRRMVGRRKQTVVAGLTGITADYLRRYSSAVDCEFIA